MDRTEIQLILPFLTFLFGLLSGWAIEWYRHQKARDLQEQKAKDAKEAILYGKRCESYGKLSLAFGDFHMKARELARLLSDNESVVESVLNEIETSWVNLIQTVNEGEGYYSSTVKQQINEYLGLPCWKDLKTQNLANPTVHKISSPLDFANKVLNQLFGEANYITVRDAISRDLNQEPPVKYEIISREH